MKYYSFNFWEDEYQYGLFEELVKDATKYAKDQGVDVTGTGTTDIVHASWWLRTPGGNSNRACDVGANGVAGSGSFCGVESSHNGVCPALYVNF